MLSAAIQVLVAGQSFQYAAIPLENTELLEVPNAPGARCRSIAHVVQKAQVPQCAAMLLVSSCTPGSSTLVCLMQVQSKRASGQLAPGTGAGERSLLCCPAGSPAICSHQYSLVLQGDRQPMVCSRHLLPLSARHTRLPPLQHRGMRSAQPHPPGTARPRLQPRCLLGSGPVHSAPPPSPSRGRPCTPASRESSSVLCSSSRRLKSEPRQAGGLLPAMACPQKPCVSFRLPHGSTACVRC